MLTRQDYARDPEALFAHAGACWRDACAGRAFPRRQDIGPARLGRALPFISLIDVIEGDPVDFRYRLIGQHLIVNTGQNLTGKRVLDLPPATPTVRPVYNAFARCRETRAPVSLELDIHNMNGTKRHLTMSVWPLGDNGLAVTGILCAGVFLE